MNGRTAKKIKREARKTVRAEFGEGMEALGNVVRRRPKWISKKLWIVLYVPLFRWDVLKHVYRHMP